MKSLLGKKALAVAPAAGQVPGTQVLRLRVAFPCACADQGPVPA